MGSLAQKSSKKNPATERGVDELMNLCEYALRDHPRRLRHARRVYTQACKRLYASIVRMAR